MHEGIMPEIRELSGRSVKLHIQGDHEVRAEWKSNKFVAEGNNLFVATHSKTVIVHVLKAP